MSGRRKRMIYGPLQRVFVLIIYHGGIHGQQDNSGELKTGFYPDEKFLKHHPPLLKKQRVDKKQERIPFHL